MTRTGPAVCLGEALIDLSELGNPAGAAGGPVFAANPGGAPANVAVGLSRLGVPAAFVGRVGADRFGRLLQTALAASGVDTGGLRFDPDRPTPLAVVTLDERGERSFRFYREGTADGALRLGPGERGLIRRAWLFHFGSVSLSREPARSATLEATRLAREGGAVVSFDPNLRPAFWDDLTAARGLILEAMRLAHFVKMSEEELEFVAGRASPEEGHRLAESAGIRLLAVTRGAAGCWLIGPGGRRVAVPAPQVPAVDTTGAGDAFVAGFWAAEHRSTGPDRMRDEFENGTRRWWEAAVAAAGTACRAAALSVTRRGGIPSLPGWEEINGR